MGPYLGWGLPPPGCPCSWSGFWRPSLLRPSALRAPVRRRACLRGTLFESIVYDDSRGEAGPVLSQRFGGWEIVGGDWAMGDLNEISYSARTAV